MSKTSTSPPPREAVSKQSHPKCSRSAITTLVSICSVAIACWAVYAFKTDQARNCQWGCEMSWMHPSYRLMDWDGLSSRYSTYLYREGGVDAQEVSGYPVVFLPGNAGSYQQARSIASSAARQFYGDNSDTEPRSDAWYRPVDFFTVDFNEDFSAFHAPTLREQAEYVASVIPRVLESYAHLPVAKRPTEVILLGHSMGGIAARLAATMTNETIAAIVTMSTPHMQPPVALDRDMDTIYETINAIKYAAPGPLLYSICGSDAETQIVPETCALSVQQVTTDSDGFAVFTTAMPNAWTGVEHQAMVWCHQVRWRVARALLDMAHEGQREAKHHRALQWFAGPSADLPRWIFGGTVSKTDRDTLRIPTTSTTQSVLLTFSGLTASMAATPKVEVTHCRTRLEGGSSICTEPSWALRPIPWLNNDSNPFPLPGEGIGPDEVAVVLDVYRTVPDDGWLVIDVPKGLNVKHYTGGYIRAGWQHGTFEYPEDIFFSPHMSVYMTPRVLSPLLAYRVDMETGPCTGARPVLLHVTRPEFNLRPTIESRFVPVHNGSVTLHSNVQELGNDVVLEIFQQPECRIRRLDVTVDYMASAAKGALRLRISVLAWSVAWAALFVGQQLSEWRRTGALPPLSAVIARSVAWSLAKVTILLVLALALQWPLSKLGTPLVSQLFLGTPHLALAPFTVATAWAACGLVVISHKVLLASLCLAGRLTRPAAASAVSEKAVEPEPSSQLALASRAASAAVLLALVKFVVPYRMALVLLFMVLFLLTSRTPAGAPGTPAAAASPRFLLVSALLLMAFQLPLNAPAIAVWGRNVWVGHGQRFAADHDLLPLLPALLLVELSSVRRTLAPVAPAVLAGRFAALALALVAFVAGTRKTWLVANVANAVFLAMSAIIVGARFGRIQLGK